MSCSWMWQSVFASCSTIVLGSSGMQSSYTSVMYWLENFGFQNLDQLLVHMTICQSSTTRRIDIAADDASVYRSRAPCHLGKTSASLEMTCTFGWCLRDANKVCWRGCLVAEARFLRGYSLRIQSCIWPACSLQIVERWYLTLEWRLDVCQHLE